jgi:hypothetical protein
MRLEYEIRGFDLVPCALNELGEAFTSDLFAIYEGGWGGHSE